MSFEPRRGAASHQPGGAGPLAPMDAMSRILAENWWAIALRGLLGVLFGAVAFLSPVATMLTLALLFAGYLGPTVSSRSSRPSGQRSGTSVGACFSPRASSTS